MAQHRFDEGKQRRDRAGKFSGFDADPQPDSDQLTDDAPDSAGRHPQLPLPSWHEPSRDDYNRDIAEVEGILRDAGIPQARFDGLKATTTGVGISPGPDNGIQVVPYVPPGPENERDARDRVRIELTRRAAEALRRAGRDASETGDMWIHAYAATPAIHLPEPDFPTALDPARAAAIRAGSPAGRDEAYLFLTGEGADPVGAEDALYDARKRSAGGGFTFTEDLDDYENIRRRGVYVRLAGDERDPDPATAMYRMEPAGPDR